jgi:hypothetical protein
LSSSEGCRETPCAEWMDANSESRVFNKQHRDENMFANIEQVPKSTQTAERIVHSIHTSPDQDRTHHELVNATGLLRT